MKRNFEYLAACAAVLAVAAWSVDAEATASRTFVSASGNNANTATNCGPTTPCRTFNAALSVTAAGGEVVVLDSGGYGPAPITISQSVTITAPAGVYAGISVGPGVDGIDISGNGIEVTLRGLTINSSAAAAATGGVGVNILAAAIVTLDRLLVQGLPIYGVSALALASTQATPLVLNVQNSSFVQNGGDEFWLVPNSTSASVTATFINVTMNGPQNYSTETVGIYLVDNVAVAITESRITNHAIGIFAHSTTTPLSLVAANCVFINGWWDIGSNVGDTSGGGAAIDLRNNVFGGTSTANLFNAAGVRIGAGATASLYSNMIIGNSVGVGVGTGGVVYSYANNQFRSNLNDLMGSLTPISAK